MYIQVHRYVQYNARGNYGLQGGRCKLARASWHNPPGMPSPSIKTKLHSLLSSPHPPPCKHTKQVNVVLGPKALISTHYVHVYIATLCISLARRPMTFPPSSQACPSAGDKTMMSRRSRGGRPSGPAIITSYFHHLCLQTGSFPHAAVCTASQACRMNWCFESCPSCPCPTCFWCLSSRVASTSFRSTRPCGDRFTIHASSSPGSSGCLLAQAASHAMDACSIPRGK